MGQDLWETISTHLVLHIQQRSGGALHQFWKSHTNLSPTHIINVVLSLPETQLHEKKKVLPGWCPHHSLAFLVFCHLPIDLLYLEESVNIFYHQAVPLRVSVLRAISVVPEPSSRPQICCIPSPMASWLPTHLFTQQPWGDRIKAGLGLRTSEYKYRSEDLHPPKDMGWWMETTFPFHIPVLSHRQRLRAVPSQEARVNTLGHLAFKRFS